jgi:hypothetical protein
MDAVFAVALVFACEACDALAKPGIAHPFAIDAAWRPRCEGRPSLYIEADPWPAAGELRRDRFTRDCAEVEFVRAFVAVDGGFTAAELFVGGVAARQYGRGVSTVRQHEFVGRVDDFSYRYALAQGDGGTWKINASIETPAVTSHLAGTALAPSLKTERRTQSIACEAWRARCELISHRVGSDVALPYFTVVFDKANPQGNLCVDGSPSVKLVTQGETVASGEAAPAGSLRACLGARSQAALERLAAAPSATYDVGDGAKVEVDTTGLRQAVALGRFLLASGAARGAAMADFQAEAKVLLDAAGVPN